MTMTMGQCKECVFFRVGSESTETRPFAIGTCMRHPPQVLLVRMATPLAPEEPPETPAIGYRYETVWPTVVSELGCGEFQPRGGSH